MKPHGRDCPDRCSMCRGAPVRRVDAAAGTLTIDGQPAGRPMDPEGGTMSYYARRGARARDARRPR